MLIYGVMKNSWLNISDSQRYRKEDEDEAAGDKQYTKV